MAENSPTPSGESATLEDDLRELAEWLHRCDCKPPEETGTRHGYTCSGHRALKSVTRGIARLRAEADRLTEDSDEWEQIATSALNAIKSYVSRAEAAEARAARLEEALATLAAFARTAPGRLPESVQRAVDLMPWDGEAVRNLNPEGGEHAG